MLGTTKTAFVEESAVWRAENVVVAHERTTLGGQEFSRFVDALDAAPAVVPGLVDLLTRPSPIPPP